jgi:hypothetical protein|tara:strand:- start:2906 stop:3013 length:108 start_codon:yes stop_codon:yes gene_type:complete
VLIQLGEKTKPVDVAETVTAVRVERELPAGFVDAS